MSEGVGDNFRLVDGITRVNGGIVLKVKEGISMRVTHPLTHTGYLMQLEHSPQGNHTGGRGREQ